MPEAELSILLLGDGAMRRMNREWRAVDRPTDVISFPAAAGPGPRGLGDVAISLDTAVRRARAEGRPWGAELDRYLAHGILHLLGFDHRRPRQARQMAAGEEALLSGEGMVGAAMGARSGDAVGYARASRVASRRGRVRRR